MEGFKTPKNEVENGLDGSVLASRIADKIEEIKKEAQLRRETQKYLQSTNHPDVKIELLGVGFSVQSVIRFLKESFDIPVKSISGDLVKADSTLELTIRMTGKKTQTFVQNIGKNEAEALKNLIRQASEHIVMQNDPILLAFYQLNRTFQEQDYDKAIEASALALKENPQNHKWAYTTWALALGRKGKTDEALKKIKLVLQTDSSFVVAQDVYGTLLSMKNQMQQALYHYRKAIALDSTYALAWGHLGEEYFWNENNEEALKCFRKAARLEPDEFNYSFKTANILYYQKDKTKAFAELTKLLDQDPSPMVATFYSLFLGSLLIDMDRYDEALETVRPLKEYHILGIEIGVSSVVGLANAYLNKPAIVEEEVEKLRKMCPAYQLCFIPDHILFVLLIKQGKTEEAFRYFESAIETQQDSFDYAERFRSLIPAEYLPRYEGLIKKSKEIFRKKRYRFF